MRYLLLVVVILAFNPAEAREPVLGNKLEPTYPSGIARYRLDHKTRVTGWRVAKGWFFGRQRGADSGLTLVWQSKQDQLSFSKDGIRFTRRF